MLFISYYTKKTPYENVITQYLEPSLKKWNLNYYIKGVDDLGDWNKNTDFKASFIKDCLEKFKQNIVFLDADATIEQYPQLFFDISNEYDIAVHFLDWFRHWRNQKNGDKTELLSGTMMFRYNNKVLAICNDYIQKCKDSSKMEQRVLQEVIENKEDIKIYQLPVEYCAVPKHDNKLPDYIKEPVILHHQVSRLYKNQRRNTK